MFVENGGLVSTLNGRIGSFGTGKVVVGGVGTDGTSATWDVVRLLQISKNGTLDVVDGGTVSGRASTVDGRVTVSGTDADGRPSSYSSSSRLTVGVSEAGQFVVDKGAQLFTDSASLGLIASGAGEVRVRNLFNDAISSWVNPNDVFVGGGTNSGSGLGKIAIGRNGRVEIGNTLKIWSTGTLELDRGQLVANTINVTDGGRLHLVDGDLEVMSFVGDLTNQGARVQADSVSGDFLNEAGVVSPGPNAGSTTISGRYIQQANGTLAIDIGGKTPGVSHDLLGIAGAAVVDGQLQVTLVDQFVPDDSDQFSILGADSIVGVFENVATGNRIQTSDGGGSFVVHYGIGSAMQENRLIAYNFLESDAVLGDFDRNGQLDATDIDMLGRAVGSDDLGFDLVYDAEVNETDRTFWVREVKNTYFGDANLDGEFNSSDFVQAFQRGEYEDTIAGNSGWADGDWNGDSEFDSGDFVLAFQAGGYETGPRRSIAAVPEPSSVTLTLIAFANVLLHRRSRFPS